MEYPALNVSLDKNKQAQFSDTTIGPYDKWVIEFGYKPNLTEIEREKFFLDLMNQNWHLVMMLMIWIIK